LNLLNNLARRREAYHGRIEPQNRQAGDRKVASIHDAVIAKEGNLERFLKYDRFPRVCLLDHLLSPSTSLEEVVSGTFKDLGNFAGVPYSERQCDERGRLVLSAAGAVSSGGMNAGLTIEKVLTVPAHGASLAVEYRLRFDEALRWELVFAVEFNLHFSSPGSARATAEDGSSGQTALPLDTPAELEGVRTLRVEDSAFRLTSSLSSDTPSRLWQFPVETVSLSEGGLERVYQASCVMPAWPLAPGLREKTLRISLCLEQDAASRSSEPGSGGVTARISK
jgi:alpha-amylase